MKKEFINQWYRDEAESFRGWDFSYLKGRWSCENTPWDYDKIVRHYLKPEHKLLDMGTGGGEYLLSLNHPFSNTYVTEAWEPNIKLCNEKLKPLGIVVKAVEDSDSFPVTSELPFEDNFFDIVINRHESYNPLEVKRVLKDNGIFITQQVGGRNNNGLSKFLIDGFVAPYPEITLDIFKHRLKEIDFDILYENEAYPKLKFYDVGAIVFFAKVIEWEFPGFSVEKCKSELLQLNEQILSDGYYESEEHRFIITARKNIITT